MYPVRGRPKGRLLPAAVAALALTAGACATSSADKSSAERAAGAAAAGESGNAEGGKKQPWWRRHIGPPARQRRPGEPEPGGRGLFSGEDGEIVLLRKGEAGRSSDPSKPSKLRRR